MALNSPDTHDRRLDLLAVTQGVWGERIADNLGRYKPVTWKLNHWRAPKVIPLVVDDPADWLPPTLPPADLVLALGETPGVAQLIPDIVQLTGAKAVIAPIDRNESLPPGLAAQLKRWLAEQGVSVVFPKPFCSLTETTYNQPPIRVAYQDATIQAFARLFGRPQFSVTGSAEGGFSLAVEHDTACGCARFVAEGLANQPLTDIEERAGMLHHHYPCLASMNQDANYGDTLMHVSGHILREAVRTAAQPYLGPTPYFRPAGRVEPEDTDTR